MQIGGSLNNKAIISILLICFFCKVLSDLIRQMIILETSPLDYNLLNSGIEQCVYMSDLL